MDSQRLAERQKVLERAQLKQTGKSAKQIHKKTMMLSKAACATLALFLLFTTATEAMSLLRSTRELRCQCVTLESKQISTKLMANIQVIPSGPHCKNVEVIITLKDGKLVCVNPAAPWVERIIKLTLQRQSSEAEAV
ncbi:interleukin-8-like [Mantella aurantiaca]